MIDRVEYPQIPGDTGAEIVKVVRKDGRVDHVIAADSMSKVSCDGISCEAVIAVVSDVKAQRFYHRGPFLEIVNNSGEIQDILNETEDHILKEQSEKSIDNYSLAVTSVNRVYQSPKKPVSLKKIILIALPVLLLVSSERNTGKATFLNLLKQIFGGNVTFNTNEDLAVPSSFAPR